VTHVGRKKKGEGRGWVLFRTLTVQYPEGGGKKGPRKGRVRSESALTGGGKRRKKTLRNRLDPDTLREGGKKTFFLKKGSGVKLHWWKKRKKGVSTYFSLKAAAGKGERGGRVRFIYVLQRRVMQSKTVGKKEGGGKGKTKA